MAQWQPILDWMGPLLQAAPHRRAATPMVKSTACRAIERAVSEAVVDEARAAAEVVTPEAEAAAAAVLAAVAARPVRTALPEAAHANARRMAHTSPRAVPGSARAPAPPTASRLAEGAARYEEPQRCDPEPSMLREPAPATAAATARGARREPVGWVARWLTRWLDGLSVPRLLQRHR
jgi:hypothetical protein